MSKINERSRMIFDLPPDVQLAIKLRALKDGMTTGEAVAQAIKTAYRDELAEAEKALLRQSQEVKRRIKV